LQKPNFGENYKKIHFLAQLKYLVKLCKIGKRSLCECDAMLARKHVKVADQYQKKYHLFWSMGGWEPEEECPKGGGGPNVPKCCGGRTDPFVIYNSAVKQCCNGTVKEQC